ncbi:MAG TPA: flagellar motor protein MotB [Bryobacterales bacterium]|nr:flagellar motor protein MotB [Bryobacterales bacterium]
MKAPKEHDHENHERWLVSYADFITLMFAFFVVMFASSQVDKKKVAGISVAFESYIKDGKVHNQDFQMDPSKAAAAAAATPEQGLEGVSRRELAPVKAELEQELAGEIGDGKIALSLQPRGLVLSLRESALFPAGSDALSPTAIPILAKVAAALRKLATHPVRLEGHTDDTPIQTAQFPSNWELSAARATAVLELLAGKFQVAPGRLAVAGYADYHPVANNQTSEGRAHNRRVDIVILSRSAAEMEPRQARSAAASLPAPASPSAAEPAAATAAPGATVATPHKEAEPPPSAARSKSD